MNSASGLSWDELVTYRRKVEGVWLISLPGLYLMKKSGRLKDRADAELIRKVLGGSE